MNEREKLISRILLAGVALGALGDGLLRAGPWALNLSLWTAALVAAVLLLAARHRPERLRTWIWLAVPLALLALAIAWRDAPGLKALNILAILFCLSASGILGEAVPLTRWGVLDYVRGMLSSAAAAIGGVTGVGRGDLAWTTSSRPALRIARSIVTGLLIAFPLLFVFGGLLVAADAVFEDVVSRALSIDFAELLSHAALFAFLAWAGSGFLLLTLGIARPLVRERLQIAPPGLGALEVATPLALLDVLFLAFVIVQVRYLFGDATLVEQTVGLTYAEYARRGFFELVAVTALALPLLLLADWVLSDAGARARNAFRLLAGLLVVLLFVTMSSAMQRMRLYVDAYGLTEMRVYASAFMVWLGAVIIWFVATVLRDRRERFAAGAAAFALLALFVLNLLSPDALVARVNVARARAGQTFDARYATSLSADAVPTLVAALGDLREEERCHTAGRILERWTSPAKPDWRTWNQARARAWRTVEDAAPELRSMACWVSPPPPSH